MNLKKYLTLSTLLLAVLLTGACAVDPAEDENYSLDRVMKSWIKVNYPGLTPYGDTGLYLLEMNQGTGAAVGDSAYVWAHYVKRSLDQTVSATNIQSLAEQIGTYTASSDYSSDIWRVDQGYLPDALEKVLKTMRAGGYAKIALPASASSHDNAVYDAFSRLTETSNQIIELTVDTVVTDIYDYQERAMKEWFGKHYARTDTVAEHLYFKKYRVRILEAVAEHDHVVRHVLRRHRCPGRSSVVEDGARAEGDDGHQELQRSFHSPSSVSFPVAK